jgi:hypothetical protein
MPSHQKIAEVPNGLFGYSNSSWADDPDNRHSTAGYVYLLADAAIS